MKRQLQTEEKVYAFVEKHHMLEKQDRVLIGVSGGADSVCLLFLLQECAAKWDLSLAVAHVNHGIRPEAAQDAAYVESLCKKWGLPFYLTEEDVRARAQAAGVSEEEMGRNIRYAAFTAAAADFGADKIAVAHNSNDRAETMLFHLFRGSDIRGLSSIRPVRGEIIRPILCLERQEIEAYLRQRGISYCQDVTNDGDAYTRNRIRHHIIPYAEREIAEGCVAHMGQAAELLAETEDYLEIQTEEALHRSVQELREHTCMRGINGQYVTADGAAPGHMTLEVAQLCGLHPLLQKRVLYAVLCGMAAHKKDISRVHVMELLQLFLREGNRTIILPFSLVAERSYGQVIVRRSILDPDGTFSHESGEEPMEAGWEPIYRVGTCEEILGCCAEEYLRTLRTDKGYSENLQKQYTKCFDYDKIIQSCSPSAFPTLRTRAAGDYLTIADGKGGMVHKSVKDYMITEKIPRAWRDRIRLLAAGHHVVWLVGYRISEYYKISANTKRILQVQLKGNHIETEDKDG